MAVVTPAMSPLAMKPGSWSSAGTAAESVAVVTTGVAPRAAATVRARALAPPAWPPQRATAKRPASSTHTTAGSVALSARSGATMRTAAPVARNRTKASTSAQRAGTTSAARRSDTSS